MLYGRGILLDLTFTKLIQSNTILLLSLISDVSATYLYQFFQYSAQSIYEKIQVLHNLLVCFDCILISRKIFETNINKSEITQTMSSTNCRKCTNLHVSNPSGPLVICFNFLKTTSKNISMNYKLESQERAFHPNKNRLI